MHNLARGTIREIQSYMAGDINISKIFGVKGVLMFQLEGEGEFVTL